MMKNIYFMLLLVAGMLLSLPANAQLSCDELDETAGALDDLANELVNVESIGVNTQLDVALRELTSALKGIASVE